ncbi:MAG TPA: AAA family ATPase [Vicinamibacterales bacterium]|nr:AAA family ATPase [Vicinamibacterales bacterium]
MATHSILIPEVLVVDPLDRGLEQLLSGCGMRTTRGSAAELTALAHPSAQQPHVIVVDTRGARRIPPSMAAVRRQHPATGVLVVAAESDPTILLEAMRAGANEFLHEPITAAALEQAIGRLIAHRASPGSVGEVFAFVGAKGGVGTTTAAVNVATTLAKTAPSQTLFADLHIAHGDAALLFGAEPRFSIVDALENTHRFDEAFFRGLLTSTTAGAALLASSDRTLVQRAGMQQFRTVIEFAVQLYRFVILDVPRSDPAALDALDAASRIVVVTNQELAAVRGASRLASTLRDRYGRDRVLVIVSRFDKAAEIGQSDIEKVVASKVQHMLPSDYRLALQALNNGRPLALDNHNKLAAGFRSLAKGLAKIDPEPQRTETSVSLFGRFTGRG